MVEQKPSLSLYIFKCAGISATLLTNLHQNSHMFYIASKVFLSNFMPDLHGFEK